MQLLIVIGYLSCGLTSVRTATKAADISQFWTDDYKVFDQVYGKTSDKEIFGSTLPQLSYGGLNPTTFPKIEASEKKERFYNDEVDNSDVLDIQGFGNQYANLLTKQSIRDALEKQKPTKSSIKFISYNDFKPISQSSDPETYSYLKTLEQQQTIDFPQESLGGFKPYQAFTGNREEAVEAYRSIQDILDAHEANKGKTKDIDQDDAVKYITNPPKGRSKKKNTKSRPVYGNDIKRCPSGRCRKRVTTSRVRSTRPYVRRIKHRIITY